MTTEITKQEVDALAQHEEVIAKGVKTFVKVGNALAAIRDERLYRAEYGTFEDYCRERWGMSRPRAYQYIDAASTVSTIVDKGHEPPLNEAQARPLAKLEPEEQSDAWEEAIDKAESEGRDVTAKDVEEVVAVRTGKVKRPTTPEEEEAMYLGKTESQPKIKKPPYTPPCIGMQFARLAIMNLEQIDRKDTEREKALTQVKEWIDENK